MPGKLMSSSGGFVNWLVAYSALLGPEVGVVMADYYLVRGRQLSIDDLYSMETTGQYWYKGRGCTANCGAACGLACSHVCLLACDASDAFRPEACKVDRCQV
eukprot:GHUV01037683.1.p2 GENE.GHUV01037683.1~~GHUV01037683.1.p2  ORF type:complete len:102 (-),score=17.25 GHUV01037683.1:24-329(-)